MLHISEKTHHTRTILWLEGKFTLSNSSRLVAVMIISESNIYLKEVNAYFQTERTGTQRRCQPTQHPQAPQRLIMFCHVNSFPTLFFSFFLFPAEYYHLKSN